MSALAHSVLVLAQTLGAALQGLLGLEGARQAALTGGDDYVIAFTLPPAHLAGLQAAGWPVHVVGRVEAGSGVSLRDHAGADITPRTRGYQHF